MGGFCIYVFFALIVLFLSLFLADFQKVLPNDSPVNDILSFHDRFWGNPLPEEHTTLAEYKDDRATVPSNNAEGVLDNVGDDYNESNADLLPMQPAPILDSALVKLFIRAEYIRVYAYAESAYKKPGRPVVVVTGQPGIGKCSVNNAILLFSDAVGV
jgi:hypothetical protein